MGITSSLPGCSGSVNLLQGRSLNPICLAPFTQAFKLIIIDPQDCAALFAPKHQTSKQFPSNRKFPKNNFQKKIFGCSELFLSSSAVTLAFILNHPVKRQLEKTGAGRFFTRIWNFSSSPSCLKEQRPIIGRKGGKKNEEHQHTGSSSASDGRFGAQRDVCECRLQR